MNLRNLIARHPLTRKITLGLMIAAIAVPLVTATGRAQDDGIIPMPYAPGDRGSVDYDYDGLTDVEERQWGLNPYNWDTDFDGLGDGDEFYNRYGFSDPLRYDSDYDGLGDGDEVHYYGTDPHLPDTDFDGRSDLTEVRNGTNPRVAWS